jgi:hypothetical protein
MANMFVQRRNARQPESAEKRRSDASARAVQQLRSLETERAQIDGLIEQVKKMFSRGPGSLMSGGRWRRYGGPIEGNTRINEFRGGRPSQATPTSPGGVTRAQTSPHGGPHRYGRPGEFQYPKIQTAPSPEDEAIAAALQNMRPMQAWR